MSSIDRIKRKRKELEIERSDVSNINKSIGKINILRDEISTTGGIDYGDIAPIRTNSNTNNVSNNVSIDLNALQEKRKSLQSQLVNYERKKNDDYWWDKDKNIISNIGNVAKKLFVDSDRKNKYAKDDKYDSLLKEYNDTIKAIETASLDNKTYKGFSGSVDKVSDTILGNAVTSRKGIESTVKKILGQTPTDKETALTYEEMLAQKARQETTGAGGVGLDILGSVTRMLPQMMVGNSTGALAMGFANYGGSAYNQARQEGATEKQATAYGVISGSLEMMLNKILPSYNIGGKNVYGKTLTDNIMNQVVTNSAFKNFVFRTVNDAAGEFTEEYLQEFLEPIIKNTVLQQDNGADFWNTMKDDVDKGLKQLGSQLFNKENLYAGSLGALTSGIMGFQSNTDAYRYEKRTGRNAETGLTANEQSVMSDEVNKRTVEAQKKAAVDSEVNKIIKEQEKTFGTLTDAEKAGIKNQVQEKLDNGEIDFTTFKLKNSEIKTIENRVKEDLQKGYIDIDTIENTLTQEKTDQIKELEQRLRNIANEQEKTQIEEKLNQLRIDRANDLKNKLRQDIYLQESYAELARKSEKFTYEAKKTDSEIKKNLAEDFKKIANNTNKSHETFETISKIAEDRGVSYGVINNEQLKQLGYDIEGKNVNGLVRTMQDGKQKVLVNLDSDKAINTIVGHETTHLLEGTKEYTNFQEYIKNYAKTKGEYDTRYKELSNLYRGVNANIETEVTADLVGDYLFTDTDFVRNLSVESPTIFKQVYDYIKHVYNLATAGSKEKRQLEQVKYKFEEAYKQSNVQVNNGIQYSMIGEKGALNATNINSKNQFLLTNLEKAKSMAKSGKSNDEIFKATGWFKQYGKWKFEISDSILDGVTINNVKKNHEYLLSDILNHKDLFIAYEDLKNTKVSFADLKNYNGYMVGGQYDAKKKNIELNNKLLDTKNPDKAIKQVLMHEVQHKIQQYEGFKNGSTGLLGEEAYKRSKGEIESRETEKRLEMSYEQRNNKIPEAVHSRMDSIPELLYNKFGKEKSVYDNNIDTDSIVDINGDFINKKSNEILEGSDAERIFRGNRKKQKELDNSSFSLDQRVSGDALLDAQDFIDEVKSVGAEVDDKYSISDTDNKGRTLSNQNEIAPRNSNLTYGEDIKLKMLPTKEDISNLTKQVNNLSKQLEMSQKVKNEDITNEIAPFKNNKVMNPVEIANLRLDDANTTPQLTNKKYEKGDKTSKLYKNVTEKSQMLPETARTLLSNEENVKYYKNITNEESMDNALKKLQQNGSNETIRWITQDSKSATATDVAEGWILLKQYSDNKDYDSMIEIAKKMRDIGTKAGQTVQAFNIMSRLTPEGMVKYAQSELTDAYNQMVKNKPQDWINKNMKDFDLTPSDVEFIMNTMKKVQNMEDGYEKRVELAKIQKLMTDKIPSNAENKIKAWMRVSMLFNPKTQVRNVVGNALIIPVNYFSDVVSNYADKVIQKQTGVRTTGTYDIKAMLKGMKDGAYQATNDYKLGINTKNMDGNRFEIGEGNSFNEKNAIGRTLNRTESMLNYVMDAGDRIFSQAIFENSISNQLKLNNATEITQEMIDIATTESLQRTWNDNNNYTKFVLDVRKMLNRLNFKGYGLGDILIPFAKTPANLTKAIVDYSPVGLISTINQGIKLKNNISTDTMTAQQQHQFVQTLGKATVGSMLYVIAYALAKAGIATGSSDDDKDTANFLKNTLGISSYSIKIGNKSFTYDWAQPIAAPLSIMTNIANKSDKTKLYEAIVGNLDTATSVLMEQSFLQSINEVLNGNGGAVENLLQQVYELPSRAVPTFVKQIADMVDETQRQTYEKDAPIKTAINKTISKIPFISQTLAPSVDTLGRNIQKYGGKNNIFNVFLNPANVNTENISKSAEEIYRLYKITGDKTMMPRVAPSYINSKGEKVILSSQEKSDFQRIAGNIVEESIENLLDNKTYETMSDEDKASIINKIVNYSYNKARKKVLGIEMSNEYNKINEYVNDGGFVSEYYINKEEIDFAYNNPEKYQVVKVITGDIVTYKKYSKDLEEIKSDKDSNGKTIANSRKQKVFDYINSTDLNFEQRVMLAKLEYPSYDEYNNEIIEYLNNNKDISYEEEVEILKQLGFEVDSYGNISW